MGELIELPVQVQRAELTDEEAAGLRAGELDDERFDRLYEGRWREHSETHWTSVDIVRRIVELLALRPGERVLDVGSGIGKFCLAGSLLCGAEFVGVEHRRRLVDVAERARLRMGAATVSFVCDDGLAADWRPFDVVYLYNPFEEHLSGPAGRIDNSVPFSTEVFKASVARADEKLEGLRPGTRVVAYWGYGGQRPHSFEVLHSERHGNGELELWRKSL